MPKAISFSVTGTPAPKGSSRAMKRGEKAVNVPSGSDVNKLKLENWRTDVMKASALAVGNVSSPPFVNVAIRLTIVFRMRRGKGHYNKAGQLRANAPKWHATKPDVGKLGRTTEDAMTGIVWDDDSRVAESLLRKRYAAPGEEGAWIKIESLEEGEQP